MWSGLKEMEGNGKMDCEKVKKNIRTGLKNYIIENGIKSLVIGVSGGVDSALCCALARPVCDELGISLIGRSISIDSNKPDEIARARDVGRFFCHEFIEVDYTDLYNCMVDFFESPEGPLDKIARGNIKARLRMQNLYCIAGKTKGMVLSTDNLTEHFLGFWTLCGDVGDFGFIQNLWKQEVYELTEYIASYDITLDNQEARRALLECINAVPTDGLGISETDLDQIGAANYGEVDIILKTWLTKDSDNFYWDNWLNYEEREDKYEDFVAYRETLKNHPVVLRHERTHFKRKWPIYLERSKLFNNHSL
jgi:NAD+ synthetase